MTRPQPQPPLTKEDIELLERCVRVADMEGAFEDLRPNRERELLRKLAALKDDAP